MNSIFAIQQRFFPYRWHLLGFAIVGFAITILMFLFSDNPNVWFALAGPLGMTPWSLGCAAGAQPGNPMMSREKQAIGIVFFLFGAVIGLVWPILVLA